MTVEAGERLQQIQQRLMARDNLLKLIQDLGLYANREDLTLTQKVDLVRDATAIVPITLTGRHAHGGNTVLSAFIIQVTHENPNQAAQLANELVTIVLDQNIQARTQVASETTAFFSQEQSRLNREIIALETEITRFKEENKDALPESVGFRQAELSRLGDAQLTLDRSLLELEEERRTILAELEALVRSGPPLAELTPEERELRTLESSLIQKQAILALSHPEVRALKNRIAALKRALEAEGAPNAGAGEEGPLASAEQAALESRLVLLDGQAKLLEDQKAALEKRREALAESLQRTPAIEIQLNALSRKLVEKQEMHAVITRKRTEAETGERLELNQQAERFEVVENAIAPQEPIAPDRKKIVVMGSGLVFVLAFGLAFLVDQARPRIRSPAQLERQLGLRPVVSLPMVWTRRERRWRWTLRSGLVAMVLLAIPGGLYAVDRYHKPLPLLAEQLVEKSGADNILRMIEQRF